LNFALLGAEYNGEYLLRDFEWDSKNKEIS